MESRVTWREERGDLGEAEQRISVEDEGDEELTGGEFRIVEWRASRIGGFPITAATPDPIRAVECLETVCTTIRTGSRLLDRIEAPLDDSVERLRPKLYYPKFR